MSAPSRAPDIDTLEIPADRWSEPFWAATARRELRLPRCAACGHWRWPAGPFCPVCHGQTVEWRDPGPGEIYSYTIVPPAAEGERPGIPVLVAFPQAGDVRLLAALVDAVAAEVRIGAALVVGWSPAANALVPVFRLSR